MNRQPNQTSEIRVRYAETDQMGVAYHGAILPWFEIARTDWLRHTGMSYQKMEEVFSIHFAVVEASFKYIQRIYYDDLIEARANLSELGAVQLCFSYELECVNRGGLCVTGFSRHACVDKEGRPVRIPDEIKRLIAGHKSS
ncbi:MAG: acyl-CoA thioesterase [Planctomycetota bacterium]